MICPQRYLARAVDVLGAEFLAPEAAAGVVRFANNLPNAVTGHILECALSGPAGAADYSVALTPGDGGFQGFLDWTTKTKELDLFTARSLLQAVQTGDADPGVIWFEHDVRSDGSVSAPSFFLAPGKHPADPADAATLAGIMFQIVTGSPPAAQLPDFLAELPYGGFLRQAGVMDGRTDNGPQKLRLVIDGVSPQDIVPFLRATKWPGSMKDAEHLANLSQRQLQRGPCRIDLDLGQRLMPTLGIELPAGGISPHSAFCHELVADGMATKEKADVLQTLCNRDTLDRWMAPDGAARLDFGLNHVKLSVPNGLKPDNSAKAYFSLIATPDFTAPGTPGDAKAQVSG